VTNTLQAQSTIDWLISGVTVLTANPDQPIIRNGFIGIQSERIVWLSTSAPEDFKIHQTLHLPDHWVTPGFVNPHTHAILTMVRGVAADLGFAPSYTPGIPKGTQVNPEQARALARLGAAEAMLAGSTLIGDNFVHADITTEAMTSLGVRLSPSWRIHDVDFSRVGSGEWHHSAQIGEKTLRSAMELHSKWKNDPLVKVNLAAHAVDTCSESFLREVAQLSALNDMAISTHLGQSQIEVDRVMIRTGKSSTEVLEEVGLLNNRLLAGHCIYVSDTDISRLAKNRAHVVHIPKCNAASGRLAPTPALKKAGINICLATDTQHGDMIELMRWALATARIQNNSVCDDWQPHHVFHMATLGGAVALGMQEDIGSLVVGKKADLVVIDASRPHLRPHINPVGTLVHTGQGRDVSRVMVNGKWVVIDGVPTQVDIDEVTKAGESACRELWSAQGFNYN
jgi:5-methylthioadenosine/S-adenosylhomocysteine deaminase